MDSNVTHNPPKAKIAIKQIFCFFGSLSADSTGIGRMRIIMSVSKFMAALKNQRTSLLIQ